MRFDQTFLAIRQRTTLEIYDLALHVFRVYFWQLLLLLGIGAAPWILINWLLLYPMISQGYASGEGARFGFLMMILVCSQAQLGTAMMTHFLGQSVFIGQPKIGQSVKAIWKVPLSFYWLHGVLRLSYPVLFFVLISCFSAQGDAKGFSTLAAILCLVVGLLVRGLRPYVTKICILEKAPWTPKKDSNAISFGRRSAALHGAGSGDIFGRFLLSTIVGLPMVFAIHSLFTVLHSWVGFAVGTGVIEVAVYWPLALWLVCGFFAIVRFLTYIDLRIRQEGWEVELNVRAEALRLEP